MTRLRYIALSAVSALSVWGAQPTQTDLQLSLSRAAAAWGHPSPAPLTIRLDYLNPCHTATDVSAWSDFATHTITINSACPWPADILQLAVTHEYGHMLLGPEHSHSRASVLYPTLLRGQHITSTDRKHVTAAFKEIR